MGNIYKYHIAYKLVMEQGGLRQQASDALKQEAKEDISTSAAKPARNLWPRLAGRAPLLLRYRRSPSAHDQNMNTMATTALICHCGQVVFQPDAVDGNLHAGNHKESTMFAGNPRSAP